MNKDDNLHKSEEQVIKGKTNIDKERVIVLIILEKNTEIFYTLSI